MTAIDKVIILYSYYYSIPIRLYLWYKSAQRDGSMGMNTSDSRSLREMGLLIVGFYWLLYTPFASIYGTERQRDGCSLCSQRWDKKGMCLGRLHISAVSGVALELQWRGTSGKREENDRRMKSCSSPIPHFQCARRKHHQYIDHRNKPGCIFNIGFLFLMLVQYQVVHSL